jgi:hypothetical protein
LSALLSSLRYEFRQFGMGGDNALRRLASSMSAIGILRQFGATLVFCLSKKKPPKDWPN